MPYTIKRNPPVRTRYAVRTWARTTGGFAETHGTNKRDAIDLARRVGGTVWRLDDCSSQEGGRNLLAILYVKIWPRVTFAQVSAHYAGRKP